MTGQQFGNRIRSLRLDAGLSQGDLADKVGVEQSYISKIEGGRIPAHGLIRDLARALNTDEWSLLSMAGYLLPERNAPLVLHDSTTEQLAQELAARLRHEQERRPIPVPVRRLPLSAGGGAEVSQANVLYYSPANADERNHRFEAYEVTGDCMEPIIMRGHYVIVDLDASPRPGNIVAIAQGDEALIKMLEERDGRLYLVALQNVDPSEVTAETRIVGVVRAAQYIIR